MRRCRGCGPCHRDGPPSRRTVQPRVRRRQGDHGRPRRARRPLPPRSRFGGLRREHRVAQLGNAAWACSRCSSRSAFVQRWGRHVPRGLLALGAGAALLSGLAGALVVATSLTGLREDHGQWGIDSLVLGVAPLGAWLLLTLAAVRDRRRPPLAAAPPAHPPPRPRRAPPRRPRPRSCRAATARHRAHAAPRRRAHAARDFSPRPARARPSPPPCAPAVAPPSRPPRPASPTAASSCTGRSAASGSCARRRSPRTRCRTCSTVTRRASRAIGRRSRSRSSGSRSPSPSCASRAPRLLVVGVPGLLAVLMLARAGFGIVSDLTAETRTTPPTGTSRCGHRSSARGASHGG